MLTVPEPLENEPVAPQCRATVERVQLVLDGAAAADLVENDPHATVCAACRDRLRAVRVLLSALALPGEPVAAPAGFAERALLAVAADRRAQARGRVYKAAAAVLALAAAVLVGVWFIAKPAAQNEVVVASPQPQPAPEVAPEKRDQAPNAPPAPEPRPIRVADALANTGQAILDVPNPLADSVAAAPKVFGALSDSFKLPPPAADPMGGALEPARRSLADLPDAARVGLEPVTGTAEKALARFLRDVESVKPNS